MICSRRFFLFGCWLGGFFRHESRQEEDIALQIIAWTISRHQMGSTGSGSPVEGNILLGLDACRPSAGCL